MLQLLKKKGCESLNDDTLFSLVRFRVCDDKDCLLNVFLRHVCVFILILNILYSNKLTQIKINLSGKYILLFYKRKSLEENVVVYIGKPMCLYLENVIQLHKQNCANIKPVFIN